jgi:hypothetical protein
MEIVKQRSKLFLQLFYILVIFRLLDRPTMQITNQNQKGDDSMFKITNLFKKFALAAMVLVIALAAFPFAGASAAGLNVQANAQPDNTRLEDRWVRLQATYQIQSNRLSDASTFIARVQALIDKATGKGWDTSAVQAALNALSAVIPAVQAAHAPGAAIIASHTGFDASGKVTDRATALATAKSLSQELKDTRTAMNGTWKALREAVRAFRQAHPRTAPTTTPAS